MRHRVNYGERKRLAIVYEFHLKPIITTAEPLPYEKRTGFRPLKVTFEPLILIRGEPILRESLIEELSNDSTILDSLDEDNR